jgi:formamidopyrimidine-DNA glycosylase
VSETQLPLLVDGNYVEVSMRHFEPGNDHADSFGLHHLHLCPSYPLSHPHQMSVDFGVKIDPMRHFLDRNDQSVTWSYGVDGQEGRRLVVTTNKMTRQVAGDNLRKHTTHKRPFARIETTLSMPELPEVETVRRSIAHRVENREIKKVHVRDDYVLRGQRVFEFSRGLEGKRFSQSCRHGKLLFFPMDDISLCVHLGMTGQLTARLPQRDDTPFVRHQKTGLQRTLQHAPDKHTHISLELDDGACLHYRDIRKFGRVFWIPENDRLGVVTHFGLGVDPLTPAYTLDYLSQGLKNRRSAVKAALLDQKFLAGLGNIYVDEALFLAGIRPGRGAYRVRGLMMSSLFRAIITVLEKGIDAGGTTLRDFVNADGQSGYNQEGLQVYGRYGEPCPKCQNILKRGVYGGRTTTWCAECQK